jgi:hypothetical protein
MRSLTHAIERLVDAYQAGAISLEELRARRERIEESQGQCQEHLAQAEHEHQQARAQQHVVNELRQLKERLHRGLERCTWEDRRAIVELLVEKVEVAEPKVVVHYIVPLGRSGLGPGSLPPSPTMTAEPTGEKTVGPSSGFCEPCPHHLFGEDAVHRRGHPGLHRQKAPQLPRQRQDPLPHGHVGEDAIDELHRLVAHPARAAARTQAAVFTREGHEHVVSTALAVAAQKAGRDVSAREVILEGVDHILRERRGVRALRVREEGGEVLADEAVEHGVVRPAGDIFCRRSEGRARTRGGRHAARSAAGVPGSCPRVFPSHRARRTWRRHGGWRPPPSARPRLLWNVVSRQISPIRTPPSSTEASAPSRHLRRGLSGFGWLMQRGLPAFSRLVQ